MRYNALKERGAASRYLSDVNINVLDPSVGSFWFIKKPCLSVILYKQARTCTVVAERASRQQQASRPDSLTGWTMLYSRQEPIARSLARGRADQTCHQGEGGEGVKGGLRWCLSHQERAIYPKSMRVFFLCSTRPTAVEIIVSFLMHACRSSFHAFLASFWWTDRLSLRQTTLLRVCEPLLHTLSKSRAVLLFPFSPPFVPAGF